jgi:hypothetical protein
LQQVLEDLRPYFAQKNIRMVFKETVLPHDQLPDSNRILINGKALEVECRAVETPDGLFESLPSDMIRQVIVAAAEGLK